MSEEPPIQIAKPDTGEEEWLALREVLESGWLTQGPQVSAFEAAFAERHGVRHAKATTSCTSALHLALAALGVGPGDEVLVPAFTWVATANVVLYCGATPVFVDIDLDTFNMDPVQVAAKVTPQTKALIAVHLFGLCADVDALGAAAPGVPIVEDAACAVGAEYKGRSAGALGQLGTFSFHPRKVITTGEGGMVTTNDDALAARVERLRNHGASVPEETRHHGPRPWRLPAFQELGFNYRMTDLQGAVGRVQLGKLDRLLAERTERAEWYREQLADVSWLRTPATPTDGRHAWQSFVCLLEEDRDREAVFEALAARGVSARPGTHAVPGLGLYKERLGSRLEAFPSAQAAEKRTLAIPLHNRMSSDDYERVVEILREQTCASS